MSLRTSVILLPVFVLVAGYVFFVQLDKSPEPKEEPPWFYSLSMDEMNRIAITYQGDEAVFVLDPVGRWRFDRPDGLPVGLDRWGGITLLLSGPKSRRLLESQPANLAPFGLESPQMRIEVDLKGGRRIPLLLGTHTPDGVGNYGQIEGFSQVFIIDSTWGQVISRLVTEPPFPEWLYRVDSSQVIEIQLEQRMEKLALVKDDDDNKWYFEGDEKTQVDEDRMPSVLASLEDPSLQELVEYMPKDLSKYGLEEPSITLLLRVVESLPEEDVRSIGGIFMRLGSLTEDGTAYYALMGENPDVFKVDAAWVRALQAVVAQPPYPPAVAKEDSG